VRADAALCALLLRRYVVLWILASGCPIFLGGFVLYGWWASAAAPVALMGMCTLPIQPVSRPRLETPCPFLRPSLEPDR
jgi:hypothetical protein